MSKTRQISRFPFVVGRNIEKQTNDCSVLYDEIKNWQVEMDLKEARKDHVYKQNKDCDLM